MNILAISHILPIPEVIKDNDFVFEIYRAYQALYPGDKVVIIKPVKINLNLITFLKGKSRLKMIGKKSWSIQNFQVEIYPFISVWGFRNIHSIVTKSIYYINRKRMNRLFSDYAFDVIHAQFIFSDGQLARVLSKKYHIPYLITTHHEKFYFGHNISKRIAMNILRSASIVTPINHSNYLFYQSLGLSNISLSPLGFSKNFIRPQKLTGKGPVKILTVAGLIKLKNIDKVILAIEKLVSKYDIHYTIIGSGPERRNLEQTVHALHLEEYVTFIDHVPHHKIADEMHKHDIFIMPSFFETFGRVYFEAMAMGIPIICARNSGIFGIFKDKEEGIAVDHTNVEKIAAELEFLIVHEDERVRMGMRGKVLVENYTWENIAKDLHMKYSNSIAEMR
ncbi:MAG: glycosyltransferase [Bacteroidales bacterium]